MKNNHTSRITLHDTVQSAIVKLSGGNPGGLRVCCELFKAGPLVDPDAGGMAGLGPLLDLDFLGIYGSEIWMLYKDVCSEDITKMLGLLRGRQLGLVTPEQIRHAVSTYGEGVDTDAVLESVRERLPRFGRIAVEAKESA